MMSLEQQRAVASHAGCIMCWPYGNPALKDPRKALETLARIFREADDWNADTIDAVTAVLRDAGYVVDAHSYGEDVR